MTTNVYLTFDGTCEAAFTSYKSILGGEFSEFSRFGEMPPSEEYSLPDSEKDKIMHVCLPISTETVLMGSDMATGCGPELTVGNNFSIAISPYSRTEADRLFQALAEGGKVTAPMSTTFWGAYFGMLTDKFGINWMINFDER